jgi:hypothetical protein
MVSAWTNAAVRRRVLALDELRCDAVTCWLLSNEGYRWRRTAFRSAECAAAVFVLDSLHFWRLLEPSRIASVIVSLRPSQPLRLWSRFASALSFAGSFLFVQFLSDSLKLE